jgi:hypothetical protein
MILSCWFCAIGSDWTCSSSSSSTYKFDVCDTYKERPARNQGQTMTITKIIQYFVIYIMGLTRYLN